MRFYFLILDHLISILENELGNSSRANLIVVTHIQDFQECILNVDFFLYLIFQKVLSLLYHNEVFNQLAKRVFYLPIESVNLTDDLLRLVHECT